MKYRVGDYVEVYPSSRFTEGHTTTSLNSGVVYHWMWKALDKSNIYQILEVVDHTKFRFEGIEGFFPDTVIKQLVPRTKQVIELEPVGPKYDQDKLRYDLIPPQATKALAEALTVGAAKYAPNSWQLVPEAERRYTAALMRHFEAYRSGEEFDPETKLSHLSHVLANVSFLLHFQQERLNANSNQTAT